MPTPAPDRGPAQVLAYLDAAPQPQRDTLTRLRAILHDLLPGATDAMKYGMPAVLVEGKGVAGYASFATHCGYYPFSGEVLTRAGDAVADRPTSKGGLRFGVDEELPVELVRRLVELRLDELGLHDRLA